MGFCQLLVFERHLDMVSRAVREANLLVCRNTVDKLIYAAEVILR